MKLLILHLSDLHFMGKNNNWESHYREIGNALQQSTGGIEHLLLIVSGDLTYSGKKEECISVAIFLKKLKTYIRERYKAIIDIQVALVPGNHDVDHDLDLTDHKKLEDISKNNLFEDQLEPELNKQFQFMVLARRFGCFQNSNTLYQMMIPYEEKSIKINLINTASFSAKEEEDQGFHYITREDIHRLQEQGDEDFVLTVMHHPHHFYNWQCKKELENAIYSRSNLIFVGHEHYESTQKVEAGEATVNIYSGGKLCNKGDWSESEFHVGVLDLETRRYESKRFRINLKANIYEEYGDVQDLELSENHYNQLGLTVKKEFLKNQNLDKNNISESNQDYFTFPLIEEYFSEETARLPREIDNMDAFLKILEDEKKVILSSKADFGKSILANAIFGELSKRSITLFINGKDVTKNFERTIVTVQPRHLQ